MRWNLGVAFIVVLLATTRYTGAQDSNGGLALLMAHEQQKQICVLQDRVVRLEEKLYGDSPTKEVLKLEYAIHMCDHIAR
jgi:hypothetical protein